MSGNTLTIDGSPLAELQAQAGDSNIRRQKRLGRNVLHEINIIQRESGVMLTDRQRAHVDWAISTGNYHKINELWNV